MNRIVIPRAVMLKTATTLARKVVPLGVAFGIWLTGGAIAQAVPAFPGAQGGGAGSVGGRGGVVIEVTNLNDSGPGSLRAAVNASGPRTVVFRVSGAIELQSVITVTNPCLTVAGQTAPGGGILLSGKNMTQDMVIIRAHDVIWRYTRIRKGYNASTAYGLGAGFRVNEGSYNVMVDHNSVSWNQDEGIGAYRNTTAPVNNITLSWNLVAEGLVPHSTGYLTGAETKAWADGMTDIDLHHNLTMNDSHRNPLLNNKSSRVVNNLFYNQASYVTQVGGGIQADIIGNKYRKGPLFGQSAVHHEVQAFDGNDSNANGPPAIYLSGNIGYSQPSSTGDQWLLTKMVAGGHGVETGDVPAAWRRTSPLPGTRHPIIAEPVQNIESSILPIVGASRRLAADGAWVSARDSVDTRLISQYQNNTGNNFLLTNDSQVGGFPVIASGTPYPDADHDGMPDAWETARGLNPKVADNNGDADGDGYTNLEEFLNGPDSITPPPLPDVIVTSLSYANGIFTSTVKNQGAAATPAGIVVGVRYEVDGVYRVWGASGHLAAGASVTNSGGYTIPAGTHTIAAYVDETDRFAESNETNNRLSQTITVP
ncbi:MAG: hypothetical protein L0387_45250 [Acidobacteria bacterium]|nr:hypothetical protein [Acidobacteriota bacterium]